MNDETSDLNRLLEQESRRLLEARMLPNEGKLTDQQRKDVVTALNAYIKKHKISQVDVQKQVTEINLGTINAILHNKYEHGPLDDYLRELNEWMEIDARRRVTKTDKKFVETRVAKRIIGCAEKAVQAGSIFLVHGPTGIGKSMVAETIAQRFPGAIYLRLSEGETSASKLRTRLLSSLRIYGNRGRRRHHDSSTFMTNNERLFEKLRGSHRMIIIDEAHRIRDSALQFLRDIYDECNVPMLLLCTKDLVERIRRDNDEDHGQLYSRFSFIYDLTKGYDKAPGGKKPLFSIAEIRKLFEQDKVKFHPDGLQYLQDVANMLGQGSLRACGNIVKWGIAIERAAKKIKPGGMVTLGEAVLRKAETDTKYDKSMQYDMTTRKPVAAVR